MGVDDVRSERAADSPYQRTFLPVRPGADVPVEHDNPPLSERGYQRIRGVLAQKQGEHGHLVAPLAMPYYEGFHDSLKAPRPVGGGNVQYPQRSSCPAPVEPATNPWCFNQAAVNGMASEIGNWGS